MGGPTKMQMRGIAGDQVSLLGQARRRFLGLSPSEAGFARRGFLAGEETARLRLEQIGITFLSGYHAALEETGLVVQPGEIVGLYSRLEAAVVVIAFEAQVVSGEYRLNPEALEIQAFSPEHIPWQGIAFKTTHWALRDWVRRRRPDIHPGEQHWDG